MFIVSKLCCAFPDLCFTCSKIAVATEGKNNRRKLSQMNTQQVRNVIVYLTESQVNNNYVDMDLVI